MKILLSLFICCTGIFPAGAYVVEERVYIPDENHPPPVNKQIRQAQEERKMLIQKSKSYEEKTEKEKKDLEYFKRTELTE